MGRFYSTPLFCYLLGFVGPYLLTFVPFVTVVGQYSAATHALILLSIAGFVLGVWTARSWSGRVQRPKAELTEAMVALPNGMANILYAWYAVAFGCLVLEFVAIGGFPLFMQNVEVIRFSMKINGLTHLLAISLGLVSVLMLYAASGFKIDATDKLACRFLGIFGFGLLLLTGNRSDAGIFLVVFFVTILLRDRSTFRLKYVLWGGGFLVLSTFINILRQSQYDPRYQLYAAQALVGDPGPIAISLYPLYLTLTYNFNILDRLVAVTNGGGITHGIYTFFGFLSIFPTKPMQFGEFTNTLIGIQYHGGLTSTYLSNFYLDFGVWGAVIGSFLHGAALQKVYSLAKSDRRFLLFYGTMYTHYLMFFYCYLYYYFLDILALPITALFGIYALRWTREADDGSRRTAADPAPQQVITAPAAIGSMPRRTYQELVRHFNPKAHD